MQNLNPTPSAVSATSSNSLWLSQICIFIYAFNTHDVLRHLQHTQRQFSAPPAYTDPEAMQLFSLDGQRCRFQPNSMQIHDAERLNTSTEHTVTGKWKMSHSNLLLLIRSATSVTLSSIYSWSQFSKSAENRWISPAFVAFKMMWGCSKCTDRIWISRKLEVGSKPKFEYLYHQHPISAVFGFLYTSEITEILNEWRGRPTVVWINSLLPSLLEFVGH